MFLCLKIYFKEESYWQKNLIIMNKERREFLSVKMGCVNNASTSGMFIDISVTNVYLEYNYILTLHLDEYDVL